MIMTASTVPTVYYLWFQRVSSEVASVRVVIDWGGGTYLAFVIILRSYLPTRYQLSYPTGHFGHFKLGTRMTSRTVRLVPWRMTASALSVNERVTSCFDVLLTGVADRAVLLRGRTAGAALRERTWVCLSGPCSSRARSPRPRARIRMLALQGGSTIMPSSRRTRHGEWQTLEWWF